ncbi:MAG: RNA polymerase sigma factor RpoD [Nitrospira sp.]|nr:RNA polymerase sigma factor RpoD [Nitrospira sp.]
MLLLVGLDEGRVSTEQVEVAAGLQDINDQEFVATLERNLIIMLGDLGIIVDDATVSANVSLPAEDEDAEANEPLVDDALSFLSDLNAPAVEPLSQYQREIGSKKTLTREQEVALAISIERGLKEAIGEAILCPAAISETLRTVGRIKHGEMSIGTIINDYNSARGLASFGIDAADGETEDDTLGEQADIGDEVARNIPHDIQLRLDRISDCCGKLAATGAQGPASEIAQAACDELYSLGLSPAFLERLQKIVGGFNVDAASYGRMVNGLLKARDAKRELVEANLRLVVWQARRYRGLPLIDLIQEGNIALLKAVDRFDHRRGIRFATYGLWWIRQSLHRAIADKGRTIRVPVHLLESMRKLHRAIEAGMSLVGYSPSLSELAETLELPKSTIWKMLQVPEEPEDICAQAECGLTVSDTMEDPRTLNPEDNAIQSALQIEIAEALTMLTPREADILRMRFGVGMDDEYTLEEVGEKYRVTRERIRQIESKALEKMAHPSRSARLRSFLERTAIN